MLGSCIQRSQKNQRHCWASGAMSPEATWSFSRVLTQILLVVQIFVFQRNDGNKAISNRPCSKKNWGWQAKEVRSLHEESEQTVQKVWHRYQRWAVYGIFQSKSSPDPIKLNPIQSWSAKFLKIISPIQSWSANVKKIYFVLRGKRTPGAILTSAKYDLLKAK